MIILQERILTFSKVGVKAIDDQTVEYTLARPEPYWNSKQPTVSFSQ